MDEVKGGWGHINIDQVMLADAAAHSPSNRGVWFDYGKDCYATVSWSDIPKSDGRRVWIGWMANVVYAGDVPTFPWRSAMTIPREVSLRRSGADFFLAQKPVHEVEILREKHFRFKGGNIAAANDWTRKNKLESRPAEIVVEFDAKKSGVRGLTLFKSAKEETVVGVDYDNNRVFLDRTKSGNITFNPQFSGIHYAPLFSHRQTVKLHIFVDACSVEVFVNDGESVITDLVFPSSESRGIEFFGQNADARIKSAELWTLNSAWR